MGAEEHGSRSDTLVEEVEPMSRSDPGSRKKTATTRSVRTMGKPASDGLTNYGYHPSRPIERAIPGSRGGQPAPRSPVPGTIRRLDNKVSTRASRRRSSRA